jgi:hypothetical protein
MKLLKHFYFLTEKQYKILLCKAGLVGSSTAWRNDIHIFVDARRKVVQNINTCREKQILNYYIYASKLMQFKKTLASVYVMFETFKSRPHGADKTMYVLERKVGKFFCSLDTNFQLCTLCRLPYITVVDVCYSSCDVHWFYFERHESILAHARKRLAIST